VRFLFFIIFPKKIKNHFLCRARVHKYRCKIVFPISAASLTRSIFVHGMPIALLEHKIYTAYKYIYFFIISTRLFLIKFSLLFITEKLCFMKKIGTSSRKHSALYIIIYFYHFYHIITQE